MWKNKLQKLLLIGQNLLADRLSNGIFMQQECGL